VKHPISVPILSEKEKAGEQVLYHYKGTYSSTILLLATDNIPDANPNISLPINKVGRVLIHYKPAPTIPIAQAIK